ncbi:MAG: ABC transporter permease [Chloroflexi bacterium]|nr:ABC transporter permease [Chloroflexota bacterium]
MSLFDRIIGITSIIVKQLLRDHRSIALIFIAPMIVMSLIGFSFQDQPETLNRTAPAIIATMSLVFVFMLTGVSFLRERLEGTLDRLLVTDTTKIELVFGYLFGFLLFALIQSTIILFFTVYVVSIDYSGRIIDAYIILIILTITSVSLGIFISTFAKNEFQIIQFIPVLISPQIFLSGIFISVEQLPWYFKPLSAIAPLTYANRALRNIMSGYKIEEVIIEIGVLLLFAFILLILAIMSIKRN